MRQKLTFIFVFSVKASEVYCFETVRAIYLLKHLCPANVIFLYLHLA